LDDWAATAPRRVKRAVIEAMPAMVEKEQRSKEERKKVGGGERNGKERINECRCPLWRRVAGS